MKCNEARRMVVPFVRKELSERDTEAFLAHVEACEDCMEELETYFMVYKAIDAIDTGAHDEYDFTKMLAEEIRAARRAIWRRKASVIFRGAVLAVAEILLILTVFTGVQMKQGLETDGIFERAILRLYMQQRDYTEEQLATEAETETEAQTEAEQKEEITDVGE